MPKVSELSNGQLSQALIKYESLLEEIEANNQSLAINTDIEKYKRIIRNIREEQSKRKLDGRKEFDGMHDSLEEPKGNSKIHRYHSSDVDYQSMGDAKFWNRAVALIIDGFFVGVVSEIIAAVFTAGISAGAFDPVFAMGASTFINVFMVPFFYYIMPVKKSGQTLGKKLLKIKVITQEHGGEITYGRAIKREWLGKFISTFVLGIGYLVHLAGKPTWHDRIADTRVVRID